MNPPRKLLPTLLTVGFLCITTAVLCAAEPSKDAKVAHSKSLMETLMEGGWVMVPIGIMSILTVYLSGDGVMRTAIKKTSPPEYEAEAAGEPVQAALA